MLFFQCLRMLLSHPTIVLASLNLAVLASLDVACHDHPVAVAVHELGRVDVNNIARVATVSPDSVAVHVVSINNTARVAIVSPGILALPCYVNGGRRTGLFRFCDVSFTGCNRFCDHNVPGDDLLYGALPWPSPGSLGWRLTHAAGVGDVFSQEGGERERGGQKDVLPIVDKESMLINKGNNNNNNKG